VESREEGLGRKRRNGAVLSLGPQVSPALNEPLQRVRVAASGCIVHGSSPHGILHMHGRRFWHLSSG